MLETDALFLLCFTVFSAVSGLELSLDNDQHECRSIACSARVYDFSILMSSCYTNIHSSN